MLTEMLTDLVFHFTSLSNGLNILEKCKFNLTASIGTEAEDLLKSGDRVYSISFARSRTADYTAQNAYSQGVVFNINGDYFNKNFRSRAVDYWERFWAKMDRTSEMEDRLFSYKPFIKFDPKKAFSEIHVLSTQLKETEPHYVLRLMKEAKKQNIPVFVYTDQKAFVLQNKKHSLSVNEIKSAINNPMEPSKYARPKRDYFHAYIDLMMKKDRSELTKDARKKLWYMGGSMYNEDMTRALSADIHNFKKSEEYQDQIYTIVKYMKKNKLKTIRSLIDHLSDKWEVSR